MSVIGSSPRVWGQGETLANVGNYSGIIPTRVGTSIAQRIDYPMKAGSSPRVWGQAITVKQKTLVFGIIPTRVGTRVWRTNEPRRCEDHPHACGDKCYTSIILQRVEGSSPRVWGQVIIRCAPALIVGIIPTRVGTSKT